MTAPPIERAPSQCLDDAIALVNDLTAGGALTTEQASWLLEAWPHLDDAWATSPYFGTVREHSRGYIDRLRGLSEDAI
jgi:hypothetical protein